MKNRVCIIIPSLNPDDKLMKVVRGLHDSGFTDIIIVNDGSDIGHMQPFLDAENMDCCTVLTHEVNKGKGRALKTAFKFIIDNRPNCRGVITVDGDNQHTVEDIEACMNKMLELENHVVLGCRDFSGKDVPKRSRIGNNITKNVFRYLCGISISDTQTGLRAIPYEYLERLINVRGERFEYETNMLLDFKEYMIPYTEVAIRTVYIEENATSHFNPLLDSIRIYKNIFKFMLSSLSSSLIDIVAFAIFLRIFRKHMSTDEAKVLGGVIARIISSLCNFTFNKKAVFKSGTSLSRTMVRYYALCVIQLAASLGLLQLITFVLGADKNAVIVVIKAIIDILLFAASFPIQRRWVFKK